MNRKIWERDIIPGSHHFDHDNILTLFKAGKQKVTDGNGSDAKILIRDTYFTVTEYCENGELYEFVDMAEGLSETMSRSIMH